VREIDLVDPVGKHVGLEECDPDVPYVGPLAQRLRPVLVLSCHCASVLFSVYCRVSKEEEVLDAMVGDEVLDEVVKIPGMWCAVREDLGQ